MQGQHSAHPTVVSFLLLDRTGSMAAIKDETIGGFNAYLDTLERQAGDLVEFTMLQFDNQSIDRLYEGARLSEVQRLTPESYQPRAYTPLIDACFETVKATEEVVARRRDKPRVIIVFQTDGEENASRKHTLDELRGLIVRRQAEGWQFVFLGAEIDAYATARGFGILEEATVSYSGSRSLRSMITLAETSVDFALGGSQAIRFTDDQKRAVGDKSVDTLAAAARKGVAKQFAVSAERIRQIEAKALRKFKRPSRSRNLNVLLDT